MADSEFVNLKENTLYIDCTGSRSDVYTVWVDGSIDNKERGLYGQK
jgi:hypothetical protein